MFCDAIVHEKGIMEYLICADYFQYLRSNSGQDLVSSLWPGRSLK